MNNQPPSESNQEKTNQNQTNEKLSSMNPKQMLDLKLEVEQIYRDVDELRKLLQTLVSGLVIGIFLALGISSWFAYRLLVQEQIARKKSEEITTIQQETLEQLKQLQQQIQSQEQNILEVQQQIPPNLTDLIEENQQKLAQLNNRLAQLQKKTSNFNKSFQEKQNQ